MRKLSNIFKGRYVIVFLGIFAFLGVLAQDKKKEKPKSKPIPVYLGKSNIDDGFISENLFDSLISQGLTSRDSAGKVYKVNGFLLTYGERNLYEDSVGNLMVLTDLLTQPCDGDTLNTYVLDNITDRSKKGDTVYFDQITVTAPEGYNANGKPMRLILTK